ncbi:SH3 domain-containing protein [Patescibacteria group bacterium]|nr:SH3 domain-containing protein [Patescibacteria group bacterium]
MFKKLLVVVLAGFFLGGCSLSPKKSGVEIMSQPTAKVFIDGKEAGMTPYKNLSLKPGTVEIKLVAREREWKRTLELKNNVSTVIDWNFGSEEKESGGYLLYMEETGNEKKSGLMVSSQPDRASVKIEGEVRGHTPMRLDEMGEGDKQINISFPGYKQLDVFVKAVAGYQMVIEAKMGVEKVMVTEENVLEEEIKTAMETVSNKGKVRIKETETGWLRVREASSSGSREIAKVIPKEEYELLDEGADWYKIDLGEKGQGWISTKYAEKL